jgi:hypothetical protein
LRSTIVMSTFSLLKDAYIMPNMNDLLQKVGSANFITTADCRSGYWQLPVRPEDRWLTAFAYDGGFWEWTRLPFGLKTSGNSFVRCVQLILNPVRDFSFSFVDDLSVCSNSWDLYMIQLRAFLTEIRKSGLTLNLKKCSFAKSEVKFLGHVVGSGRHRPDEENYLLLLIYRVLLLNAKCAEHLVFSLIFVRTFLMQLILRVYCQIWWLKINLPKCYGLTKKKLHFSN